MSTRSAIGLPALCTTDNQASGIAIDDLVGASGTDPAGSTALMGGTSGATPQVAAAAGLVLSVRQDLSGQAVREILMQSASQATLDTTVDPNGDPNLGGIDGGFSSEGRSLWYGAGLLDATAAIKLALNWPSED